MKKLRQEVQRILKSNDFSGLTMNNAPEELLQELALLSKKLEDENDLERLLTEAPVIIFCISKEGVITRSEGAGLKVLNVKDGDLVGLKIEEAYKDYPSVKDNIARALTGQTVNYIAEIDKTFFECNVTPVFDKNGALDHLFGVALDVTLLKLKDIALKKEQERYQNIVELAEEGIWIIDAENITTYVNPKMANMLGFENPSDMLGSTLFDHMNAEGIQIAEDNLQRRQAGLKESHEFLFLTQKRKPLWARLATTPLYDEEGKYAGALAMVSDITLYKNLQNEWESANKIAEHANKSKSQYLSNMSHEIRTPLNAILGFAQILKRDPQLNVEQTQMIDMILKGGDHLLKLINEVLDIAKIEAGKLEYNAEEFDLNELLEYAEATYSPEFAKKNIQLQVLAPENLTHRFIADLGKLRQILFNLLSNALKFTEAGKVTLSASFEQINAQEYHLVFSVSDTGCGMSEKELQHVFEAFMQSTLNHKGLGTGLGLHIAKQLVEFLGGEITVSSQINIGTNFHFWINTTLGSRLSKEIETLQPRVLGIKDHKEYRLLVVDDNASNCLVLSKLLLLVGFNVKVCNTGSEAIALTSSWRPHAVLIDKKMPVMDGITTSLHLRELPDQKQLKIFMISAGVFKEDRQEIDSALIDDFITKPFKENDILMSLQKHLKISYIFSHEQEEAQTLMSAERMQKHLRSADRTWLAQMHSACINSDYDTLLNLCEGHQDITYSETLIHYLNQFDYEWILSCLSAVMSTEANQVTHS